MSKMAELARALGKSEEAADFEARAHKAHAEMQTQLFDSQLGIYRDGVGTDHTAQHATLFPLAFDLVPEDKRAGAVDWLYGGGMKCSVYAAQYLLEGLFKNGGDEQAIELMMAPTDRSWRHMIESGTTMTWEAWDQKYKTNQDWNHPWGTAPANLLPRFVLGVEALQPGWQRARIRPCLSGLTSAKGKVPTPRGPIYVDWVNESLFKISLAIPEGVAAQVELPASENSTSVFVNGKRVSAQRLGSRWVLDEEISGSVEIEVR
jgi:alpha-L-rhamnosidase